MIYSVLNREDETNKLSGIEQSSLRKTSDLSVYQMFSITKTLNNCVRKAKNDNEDNRTDLNPFIDYKFWHKIEVESLPSNVEFHLHDKEKCVHQKEVSSTPLDMNEEYDQYGCEEDPRPNMTGSFYPPTWIVVRELESMSKMLNQPVILIKHALTNY